MHSPDQIIAPRNERLACAVLAMCLAGCSDLSKPDYGGALIAAPGTFACFGNQIVVKVEHETGLLNYRIANSRASAGPAQAAIEESSAWVIFPESPQRVWVFDGARDVTLIEIYPDGGSKFTSSQVVSDLLQRAPAELVDRLPAEFAGQAP